MTIVIIEDEKHTALDLKEMIQELDSRYSVQAVIDSVEEGVDWFTGNPHPDLIFSDIKLGDGLAFDIFRQVDITCPVIFCTAYDEYAIVAFRNNGIDYLLKPIQKEDLKKSLARIEMFKTSVTKNYDPGLLDHFLKEIETEQGNRQYKSNLLVTSGEKMIPIGIVEVACFKVVEAGTDVITRENKKHRIRDTLAYLESVIHPQEFYRANRQFLISYDAIQEVEQYDERKLLIHLHPPVSEQIIVSKEKATDFLKWMEER